jgi:serine/threonine protein kinase
MTTSSDILLERVRVAIADEYTIEREIGRGGMAAVFLARDIALERRVAIKVMLPDLTDVGGSQDRFVIEARTAAHLDHPGIVTVYSVKQRAGLLFIVMKYLEGRTLEEIMHGSGAHDPAVVTAIVRQVAEALQFAHSEGVVHRDVKPGNIIIDARGRPVVTDFGIAKVLAARSITVAGSMLGTPAYMSPEQCRGLPATAASDQYALGVVTYEMLTGRPPFVGTIFELIAAHSTDSPKPIRALVMGIDPNLEATVMRMLAKNPADRWASLGEVAQRLGGTSRRQGPPPELDATISAFARGEPTLPVSPDAITVSIPPASREAATVVPTTPARTPTPPQTPGLTVMPHEPTIEAGTSLQLLVSEVSGATIAGTTIAFRSEDPTIATVDGSGVVSGISAGYAKITVTAGAALGRVGVTVNARRTVVVAAETVEPAPRTSVARRVAIAGVLTLVVVAGVWFSPLGRRGQRSPGVEPVKPAATVPSTAPDSAAATGKGIISSPPPSQTNPIQQSGRSAPPPKPDSARAAAAREDSARKQCPRLLERISLGEKLTDADSARFARLCTR